MAKRPASEVQDTWYTWDKATPGDKAPGEAKVEVTEDRVQQYVDSEDDTNRLYVDKEFARKPGFAGPAIPVSMVCRVAPNRRNEVMAAKGYVHPVRPTPFAHWQCKTFAPLQVGDVITSTAELSSKDERRGRHYVTWHVVGHNQRGEKVCEYYYSNLWDEGKPDDKTR